MFVIVGTLIHSTWVEPLQILNKTAIGIKGGKIAFIEPVANLPDLKDKYNLTTDNIQFLPPRDFLIPGFVDTHFHAPQYVIAGKGLDRPLLDWLKTYTYPLEMRYEDTSFAKEAYDIVIRRLLRNGTTTASYFATIHLEATLELCQAVMNYGQRALVGKVCMNRNDDCEEYVETTSESLINTERFIREVNSFNNPIIQPTVTPRFAITADEELLEGLGYLAAKYDLHIQSHISENKSEIATVEELYPDRTNYTDVYNHAGLMTKKTIMAHGIWLSDDELDTFKEIGASIAHCPDSNISITSGLCDVRHLLEKGVKVGLGTDIGAGYGSSILAAMRFAINTSKVLSMNKGPEYKILDHQEVFRLATLGGSQALAMEDKIGNFEVGKQFDALRISPTAPDGPIDVYDSTLDSQEGIFEKFIFNGDDRNIREVYVAGQKVLERISGRPHFFKDLN